MNIPFAGHEWGKLAGYSWLFRIKHVVFKISCLQNEVFARFIADIDSRLLILQTDDIGAVISFSMGATVCELGLENWSLVLVRVFKGLASFHGGSLRLFLGVSLWALNLKGWNNGKMIIRIEEWDI